MSKNQNTGIATQPQRNRKLSQFNKTSTVAQLHNDTMIELNRLRPKINMCSGQRSEKSKAGSGSYLLQFLRAKIGTETRSSFLGPKIRYPSVFIFFFKIFNEG